MINYKRIKSKALFETRKFHRIYKGIILFPVKFPWNYCELPVCQTCPRCLLLLAKKTYIMSHDGPIENSHVQDAWLVVKLSGGSKAPVVLIFDPLWCFGYYHVNFIAIYDTDDAFPNRMCRHIYAVNMLLVWTYGRYHMVVGIYIAHCVTLQPSSLRIRLSASSS